MRDEGSGRVDLFIWHTTSIEIWALLDQLRHHLNQHIWNKMGWKWGPISYARLRNFHFSVHLSDDGITETTYGQAKSKREHEVTRIRCFRFRCCHKWQLPQQQLESQFYSTLELQADKNCVWSVMNRFHGQNAWLVRNTGRERLIAALFGFQNVQSLLSCEQTKKSRMIPLEMKSEASSTLNSMMRWRFPLWRTLEWHNDTRQEAVAVNW